MKEIKPAKTLVIILILILFPSSVMAAWWNPLSWSIFHKKTTTTESQSVIEEITQNPTTTPEVNTPKVYTDVSSTKTLNTQRESDKAEIRRLVKSFAQAIIDRNGVQADALVSKQSKSYLRNVLYLSKTADKHRLLTEKFTTITAVIITRNLAASSTIDLKESDIISNVVSFRNATSTLDIININNLRLDIIFIQDDSASVTINDGKYSSLLYTVKENGKWMIDYVMNINSADSNLETQIQKRARDTGKNREELMESLIYTLFTGSDLSSNYLAWVPLNERNDLKINESTFIDAHNSYYGYKIRYPSNWDVDNSGTTNFLLAPYSFNNIRPQISITTDHDPKYSSLEKYARFVQEDIKEYRTDVDGDFTSKKIKFKNLPAYEITYDRLRTFDDGKTYSRQHNKGIVIFRNGHAYYIEYRNSIGDFEKSKPLADKIIDTIRFGETCRDQECKFKEYVME